MYNMEDFRPKKLLCIVAHPDDIEVTLGGSVAKWTAAGTEVSYLICTDGSKGTDDDNKTGEDMASIRAKEQQNAAETLNCSCTHQLENSDCEIQVCDELLKQIICSIRTHKPDTVFTIDPSFLYSTEWDYPNHRDHRVVGQATFDAVYPMARDIGCYPELYQEGYMPHKVKTLIMTNFNTQNYFINVTDYLEQRNQALRQHKSQFGDANGIIEYLDKITSKNGEKIGVPHAEGFVKLDIKA